MCRMLGYLGSPVPLDHFLYEPDSSLLRQATDSKMLKMLNLAGFGLAAWDAESHRANTPFQYHNTRIPSFDRNLRALSSKIRAQALIAHVRGVPFHSEVQVNEQNLHPFRFSGARLAAAHNGDLARFPEMRFELLEHVRPEIARQISGSTDSEWIYALILSGLEDSEGELTVEQIEQAVRDALRVLRSVRQRLGIETSSSVNLVVSDGQHLVATRFCLDFGRYVGQAPQGGADYLSLWYATGRDYGFHQGEWKMTGGASEADSVIVSSEPLTRDVSTWVEVPEYSLLSVSTVGDRRTVRTAPLDV